MLDLIVGNGNKRRSYLDSSQQQDEDPEKTIENLRIEIQELKGTQEVKTKMRLDELQKENDEAYARKKESITILFNVEFKQLQDKNFEMR